MNQLTVEQTQIKPYITAGVLNYNAVWKSKDNFSTRREELPTDHPEHLTNYFTKHNIDWKPFFMVEKYPGKDYISPKIIN